MYTLLKDCEPWANFNEKLETFSTNYELNYVFISLIPNIFPNTLKNRAVIRVFMPKKVFIMPLT